MHVNNGRVIDARLQRRQCRVRFGEEVNDRLPVQDSIQDMSLREVIVDRKYPR